MTSPAPDWVDQTRRFLAGSGLADVLGGLGRPGRPAGTDPAGSDPAGSDPAGSDPAGSDPAGTEHSAECRWCPLCAGLAALRGRRPDLVEGLADVLATAAAMLRAHATAAPDATAAGDHHPGAGAAGPDTRGPRTEPSPAPVQRIEVV
jgi:hypothetical protein